MEIYELKDGMPVRQIVGYLELDDGNKYSLLSTRIITDGNILFKGKSTDFVSATCKLFSRKQ